MTGGYAKADTEHAKTGHKNYAGNIMSRQSDRDPTLKLQGEADGGCLFSICAA